MTNKEYEASNNVKYQLHSELSILNGHLYDFKKLSKLQSDIDRKTIEDAIDSIKLVTRKIEIKLLDLEKKHQAYIRNCHMQQKEAADEKWLIENFYWYKGEGND